LAELKEPYGQIRLPKDWIGPGFATYHWDVLIDNFDLELLIGV